MAMARRVMKSLFGPRTLLAVNTVSCGTLMGLGDWILQRFRPRGPDEPVHIDWARTGRMFTMGIMFGPVNHYWYKYLDKILPSTQAASVGKKILMDQLLAAPVFTSYFFMVMGFLEGHSVEESVCELRSKFWTVYLVDCLFWPGAQSINFFFVPTQFRVIYIGAAAVIYNTFLSFMKHESSGFPDHIGHTSEVRDSCLHPTKLPSKSHQETQMAKVISFTANPSS